MIQKGAFVIYYVNLWIWFDPGYIFAQICCIGFKQVIHLIIGEGKFKKAKGLQQVMFVIGFVWYQKSSQIVSAESDGIYT